MFKNGLYAINFHRGEAVKAIIRNLDDDNKKRISSPEANPQVSRIKFDYLNLRDDNPTVNPSENHKSNSGYSEEEKKVLAVTSMINGREYVPFMSVDLKERFAFPVPYTGTDLKIWLMDKLYIICRIH